MSSGLLNATPLSPPALALSSTTFFLLLVPGETSKPTDLLSYPSRESLSSYPRSAGRTREKRADPAESGTGRDPGSKVTEASGRGLPDRSVT